MKKLLLAAVLVVGTMSYAQGNKVIVPIPTGNGEAILPIEVSGKIFDPNELSLVVEIKSAVSASGTGFALEPADMFMGSGDIRTVEGKFDVYVTKGGTTVADRKAFTNDLKIGMFQNGAAVTVPHKVDLTNGLSGLANDVELNYDLIGGDGTGTKTKLIHSGGVKVTAKAGAKPGDYSDTSMQLKVAINGQS